MCPQEIVEKSWEVANWGHRATVGQLGPDQWPRGPHGALHWLELPQHHLPDAGPGREHDCAVLSPEEISVLTERIKPNSQHKF